MRHLPRQNEKALVIGSGIGGLSMAIILSKLGFVVTVIEKNRQPGGMLRSYVRRGIHCNVGLHYLGALDKGQVLRRLFDYLGITEKLPLKRMGVDGPVDRYYFTNAVAGPRQFDMPVGLDAYEDHLKEAFPKEQGPIDGFMALLRQSAGELDLREFLFSKPVHDIPFHLINNALYFDKSLKILFILLCGLNIIFKFIEDIKMESYRGIKCRSFGDTP